MDKTSVAKGAGFLLLVFLAALGGVWAGLEFRNSQGPPAGFETPASKLAVGEAFPAVALVSPAGQRTDAAALVDDGGVVMFLRLDCEPCGVMVTRWQQLQDAGELAGVPTVGITTADPSEVEPYRREKGLGFPIYVDPDGAFVRDWEVRAVPYVVVVGPDGAVRQIFSSPREIDGDEIRRQVGLA
jgi:peroxiredoxin